MAHQHVPVEFEVSASPPLERAFGTLRSGFHFEAMDQLSSILNSPTSDKNTKLLSCILRGHVSTVSDDPAELNCALNDLCIAIQNTHEACLRSTCFVDKGLIWLRMRNPQRAETDFIEALRYNEFNHRAWCNLGWINFNREDYSEAEYYFRSAIHSLPSFLVAQQNLAMTLKRLGRLQEAISLYKNVLESNEQVKTLTLKATFECFVSLAYCYLEVNEYLSALNAIQAAKRMVSIAMQVQINCSHVTDYERSLLHFLEHLSASELCELHFLAGRALMFCNFNEEALIEFSRALEQNHSQSKLGKVIDIRLNRAYALLLHEKSTKITIMDGILADTQFVLDKCCENQVQGGVALQQYQIVALDIRGKLYGKNGQYHNALSMFIAAAAIDNSSQYLIEKCRHYSERLEMSKQLYEFHMTRIHSIEKYKTTNSRTINLMKSERVIEEPQGTHLIKDSSMQVNGVQHESQNPLDVDEQSFEQFDMCTPMKQIAQNLSPKLMSRHEFQVSFYPLPKLVSRNDAKFWTGFWGYLDNIRDFRKLYWEHFVLDAAISLLRERYPAALKHFMTTMAEFPVKRIKVDQMQVTLQVIHNGYSGDDSRSAYFVILKSNGALSVLSPSGCKVNSYIERCLELNYGVSFEFHSPIVVCSKTYSGLFSLAYLVELAQGHDIEKVLNYSYDISMMKPHLETCLRKLSISRFPRKQIE